MQNPNDHQIGGDHYRSQYQVWDLVVNTGMGFLEANAFKYVFRWRKKGGAEDLKKALHYVSKLLSVLPTMASRRATQIYGLPWVHAEVQSFFALNNVPVQDVLILNRLATWDTREDLLSARDGIIHLIDVAVPYRSPFRDTEGE